MNKLALLCLLAAGLTLAGCSGFGSYAYCLAVDHDINRKCQ